ncbi:hypothetical protein FB567DRAFT_523851 [Paraphoma chrysanthemicola]|uniref:Uncharacterized protein n=1 Tax=Paraphoma chrysanthemicola TaxID=798071 RepID=A0A8K0R9I1_9PLEO|nr:hypothetical protein FB567DRAFT_523851 [Paraphoma chrysanthemicola]
MDEPARKRRKTSSPPAEPPSSPLRKPPRRPSFASPTKASLARNYPNLLPSRPTSAGSPSRPSSRGDLLARGKQARAFVLGEADVQESLSQEVAREEAVQETRAGAQQRRTAAQNVTPRARRVGGERSGRVPVDARDEEEPELPTTPSQQGFEEQDGPRRGVLFSSPSKRPPRVKDPVKQSPLRPQAPAVQEASSTQNIEDGPSEIEAEKPVKKPLPDPELEKKKQEKARLQREVAELEAQVSRCTEEIVKEQQRDPGRTLGVADRLDLQDFIKKVSGVGSEEKDAPLVSSLLCSFLPFSTVTIPPPKPKQDEKPVPSHRPVELRDPLPYLEMFTTFKYSTRLGLPRGKVFPSSNRVHQKHTIDVVGPQKLLSAQLSIVIDAIANEIIDMNILRLSTWAERELGTYIRQRAEEKDLSNACWAIESYWTIAQKRAQYWHRCETAFAHLLGKPLDEDAENVQPQMIKATKISRKDLNRSLGRESMILQDKHVLLKINWRIGFDWTGEAESEVSIEPAFPSAWTEADYAKTFSRVPETFASLLQTRGAFEATSVMTALLFAR